ncbi:hypothetical protein CNR22_22220 [Sphingobacteriaceae bacterium]|nr:hypothetical protein CNR22_22220 [Sphingobacteriaceae bacterium]
MLADVFLFLSIYLCFLFFVFFSGFFSLQFFKSIFVLKGFYTKTFVCLLCGLLVSVTLFAIFKTQFLTVTVFFPIVCIFAFKGKIIRLQAKESYIDQRKPVFFFRNVFLVLLPFIYFALQVFKTGGYHYKALEYDNAVYGHLSNYIASTGIENKWFSYFTDHSSIKSIEPYHYVECWLNAFVSSVFKTNSLLNFYLVTYPLLILISCFGILAIMEHYAKVTFTGVILSFLLLFIGAVFSIKQSNYHFNTLAAEVPLQHYGEKFSVYYPFVLFSVLLLLNKLHEEALLFGLSLCIVSSTMLPAIIVFTLVITLFFFRRLNKVVFFRAFLFLFCFLAFYKYFASSDYTYTDNWRLYEFSDLETLSFSFQWFKLAISNFIYAFFKSLVYFLANYFYLPILYLAGFVFLKREVVRPLLFLSTLCLCGLLVACFFYKMLDNYQLFTNTLPLLHVLSIVILLQLLHTSTALVKTFSGLFILAFFGYTVYCSVKEYNILDKSMSVSNDYLIKSKALISDSEDHQVAFIYNQADADTLLLNRSKNYLYHLSYLGMDAVPLRMSLPEVRYTSPLPVVQADYDRLLEHELFYSFYNQQTADRIDKDSLELNFLRSYKIRYVLLSPTVAVPNYMNSQNSIIVNDSKTGVRFIKLLFN